jgi:putative ABC transport system permease protein
MMRGWLTALRIARREAWRAKGRSALVVALIGLPVLALTFAAVTYDSFRLTETQELERSIGAADALVHWEYDRPVSQSVDGQASVPTTAGADADTYDPPEVTEAELQAVLPPSSRLVPLRRGQLDFHTATGIGGLASEEADLADPIHEGRIALRDGRAPAAPGEVAITREASDRLGASIGDQVSTADNSHSWTVVGVVEYLEWFQEAVVFYPATPAIIPANSWLVDAVAPVTWDQVLALNQHGIVVRSMAVVRDPPPDEQIDPVWQTWDGPTDREALAVGVLVSGLALLEVVLLAGPAFAVGARRRQRELALVAASGGTPAHQRRIVLADGVVLGLAGAVAGIAVGALAAVAGIPLLEELFYHERAGGVRLWPAALAAIAGLAVVIGLLAALVPAAVAARQDVVAALAGRRGVVRSRRRWLVLGLALTALGAVVASAGAWRVDSGLVLGGLVASELGLVLCTPALVGLVARTGRVLPLAPRIALRDTARNRAAAAPAISAVMAAVAGSVALGMFIASDNARWDDLYEPGMPPGYVHIGYEVWSGDHPARLPEDQRAAVRAAMQATLPAERVVDVPGPACPPDAGPEAYCSLSIPTPPENECPHWEAYSTRQLTGDEQRAALADPRCDVEMWSGESLGTIVDDGTLLPSLTGASGGDAAAAAATLRAGGVVVSDPLLLVGGSATIEVWTGMEATAPSGRLTAPAYVLTSGAMSPYTHFVSPDLVAAAGMVSEPARAVAVTSRMPSQAEQDATTAAVSGISPDLYLGIERRWSEVRDPTILILTLAAGVITLGAAAIATGLAATDRRADLSTLGAVGASPRVRRMLSLSQSGVVAGLGAVLGSAAGLGAALTVMVGMNRRIVGTWPVEPPYPLLVPWPTLLVVLVAVPVVAMLGAGLLTRSRLPIERRLT